MKEDIAFDISTYRLDPLRRPCPVGSKILDTPAELEHFMCFATDFNHRQARAVSQHEFTGCESIIGIYTDYLPVGSAIEIHQARFTRNKKRLIIELACASTEDPSEPESKQVLLLLKSPEPIPDRAVLSMKYAIDGGDGSEFAADHVTLFPPIHLPEQILPIRPPRKTLQELFTPKEPG